MKDVEYWEKQAQKQITDKTVKVKSGRVAYLLREILKLPLDNSNVLEIGCGAAFIGYILSLIYPRMNYTGVEIAPTYLNNPLPVEVKEGRITNIPYPDETAHFVFLFDVLEHINKSDRWLACSEISRVLCSGGMVVINNPVSASKHDPDFECILDAKEIGVICDNIGGDIVTWRTTSMDKYENSFNYILIRKVWDAKSSSA